MFELEYIDLKKAFRKSRPVKIKPVGLRKVAKIVGVELVEPQHSALNDAVSALNILKKVIYRYASYLTVEYRHKPRCN